MFFMQLRALSPFIGVALTVLIVYVARWPWWVGLLLVVPVMWLMKQVLTWVAIAALRATTPRGTHAWFRPEDAGLAPDGSWLPERTDRQPDDIPDDKLKGNCGHIHLLSSAREGERLPGPRLYQTTIETTVAPDLMPGIDTGDVVLPPGVTLRYDQWDYVKRAVVYHRFQVLDGEYAGTCVRIFVPLQGGESGHMTPLPDHLKPLQEYEPEPTMR